jgi:hypothetical protein
MSANCDKFFDLLNSRAVCEYQLLRAAVLQNRDQRRQTGHHDARFDFYDTRRLPLEQRPITQAQMASDPPFAPLRNLPKPNI